MTENRAENFLTGSYAQPGAANEEGRLYFFCKNRRNTADEQDKFELTALGLPSFDRPALP